MAVYELYAILQAMDNPELFQLKLWSNIKDRTDTHLTSISPIAKPSHVTGHSEIEIEFPPLVFQGSSNGAVAHFTATWSYLTEFLHIFSFPIARRRWLIGISFLLWYGYYLKSVILPPLWIMAFNSLTKITLRTSHWYVENLVHTKKVADTARTVGCVLKD